MKKDPYQWFFPAGILFGILGTGFWIAFWLKIIPFYPAPQHSEAMIGGFLLTVAIGFLMTAVPKFTGTLSATFLEKASLFVLVLGLWGASFLTERFYFHLILLLEILLLVRFALSRFLKSVFRPTPSFILVAFGIFSVLTGDILFCLHDKYLLSAGWVFFARLLVFYALFFFLVLGIGTQLVPSILGIARPQASTIQPPTPLNQPTTDWRALFRFILYGILIFFSFVMEAFLNMEWGRLLRAVVVTFIMLYHWRIYLLKPLTTGILNRCLWGSAWMVVLGVWPPVLHPSFAVHGAHILFIGALSLMVFVIMTRVSLSHGGHPLTVEKKAKGLWMLLIFLGAALVTRLLAPFVQNYYSHLAYASIFWIAAAICWSAQMLLFFRARARLDTLMKK